MPNLPSPDESEGEDAAQVLTASETARIDVFLASHMPAHVSRSRVKTLILQGQATLNGAVCGEPKRKVKAGDRITIAIPPPEDALPMPEAIPLAILHEDEDLIIIDKPAGLVVHPAPGNWTGTLVNALLHHCGGGLTGIGGVKRPGIVHRLDRDTSGVMVAAKTALAQAGLADQFADHGRSGALERTYLALVWGSPLRGSGTIDAPLGRSGANRTRRAVVRITAIDAREAITHYKVLKTFGAKHAAALVQCRLETGRTHQIRVHMAHIGHPLVGDAEYGGHFSTKANALPEPARSAAKGFARQALHAASLAFEHPGTGAVMRFDSPVPEDFSNLLAAFETIP